MNTNKFFKTLQWIGYIGIAVMVILVQKWGVDKSSAELAKQADRLKAIENHTEQMAQEQHVLKLLAPKAPPVEVGSLTVGGKRILRFMTWDEALPVLNLGTRLTNERLDPDAFIEVRHFKEGTYSFIFVRTATSPFTITRIREGYSISL